MLPEANISHEIFFKVTVEDIDISANVTHIFVYENDRSASTAFLTIPDPSMLYIDAFQEGSRVVIDMGYIAEHSIAIRGVVTQIQADYNKNKESQVRLKINDESILMGLEIKKITWDISKNITCITDIVTKIADEYSFQGNEIKIEHDRKIDKDFFLIQDGISDLAFLQYLANYCGCRFFLEYNLIGTRLRFLPEKEIFQAAKERILEPNLVNQYTLEYGKVRANLLNFSVQLDTVFFSRPKDIESIDSQTSESISNQESSLFSSTTAFLSNFLTESPPNSQALAIWGVDHPNDAKNIVALYQLGLFQKQKYLKKIRTSEKILGHPSEPQNQLKHYNIEVESQKMGMRASGEVLGNMNIQSGYCVRIVGISSRFDGIWYVISVTHQISSQGFITKFECSR